MAKQVWEVGKVVVLNKRHLVITGQLPAKRPGEASRWELCSGDGQRAYIWTPFRGLKLVRGEPTRPRRRKRRPATAHSATHSRAPRVRAVTNKGAWGRLLAFFKKPRKPSPNVTITGAP